MLDALRFWARVAEPDEPDNGLTAEAPQSDTVERDLVARAKRDRAAFAPLYVRYFPRVYRHCYYRLGSWAAADDAASLAFLKAITALSACRDDAFRAWLFSIVNHVLAATGRGDHHEHPLDEVMDVHDAAPGPETRALAADAHVTVRKLLAHLSQDQRRIVELRLAGLTGPEIAAVLGRSHADGRVAQFRAYARLREVIETDPELQEWAHGRA